MVLMVFRLSFCFFLLLKERTNEEKEMTCKQRKKETRKRKNSEHRFFSFDAIHFFVLLFSSSFPTVSPLGGHGSVPFFFPDTRSGQTRSFISFSFTTRTKKSKEGTRTKRKKRQETF